MKNDITPWTRKFGVSVKISVSGLNQYIMSKGHKKSEIMKLVDKLDQIFLDLPSESEVTSRLADEGIDSKNLGFKGKAIISQALSKAGVSPIKLERFKYERAIEKWNKYEPSEIPADKSEQKNILYSLLGNSVNNEFGTGATAQFRNLTALDETDMTSILKAVDFLDNEFSEDEESDSDKDSDVQQDVERNQYSSHNSPFYKSPEDILEDLEINEPDEIDVEAIAFSQGALVIYDTLQKCEAYTVSNNQTRAVIVVNDNALRSRQRFSVAHELGHWMRDRRYSVLCSKSDYSKQWYGNGRETLANQYAKELLLPESMFRPLAKNRNINFETLRELAEIFSTSLTATAIKLVESGSNPTILVFSKFPQTKADVPAQRAWYIRGTDIANDLHPKAELSDDALAHLIRIDDETHEVSGMLDAGVWFNNLPDEDYLIEEYSIRINCNSILTILTWDGSAELT